MQENPSIYIITNFQFNHHLGRNPIDARLIRSNKNIIYYLIDHNCPSQLSDMPIIFEHEIDPLLQQAGKSYLSEWSFFLSEFFHGFCQYPFFVISSRFYEKNKRLKSNLDQEWDRMFMYLKKYGWGYLPSYDRDFEWQDTRVYQQKGLLPITKLGRNLISEYYGVRIPGDYNYMSDFYCNYIGFHSRKQLESYVQFYLPLLNQVFDNQYKPKIDISKLVLKTNFYRKEKPFTFFLELISHLFFYVYDHKFFGLHYDGYYEIDEKETSTKRLGPLSNFKNPVIVRSATDYETYTIRLRVHLIVNQLWAPLKVFLGNIKVSLIRTIKRFMTE